jgi:alkylresorcinol/alkylpyrone synthase
MASIVATATGFPTSYYSQDVLATVVRKYLMAMNLEFDVELVNRFFTNVMIDGRYFALPLESFFEPPSPSVTAAATTAAALDLVEMAVRKLLEQANLEPQDISQITSVSLTTLVPSMDARLMNRIPFPATVKRMPLAGVGCMGGAFALARLAEYLEGHPTEAAIVFAVELASTLWQGSLQADLYTMITQLPTDPSQYSEIISTIVTAALFGDGCGAVLMVGREHPLAQSGKPRVIDSRSILIPNTVHLMGMEIVDTGIRNILKPQVGEVARIGLRQAIDDLFAAHDLSVEKIDRWIVHPGGPKVIQAVEEEFGLDDQALNLSRQALAKVGNLSSPTVLYMLDQTLAGEQPAPGAYGLLVAMGPGFSQEVILLQW